MTASMTNQTRAEMLVAYAMAKDELEATEGYLRRGRSLVRLSSEELNAAYVSAHRAWASQPADQLCRQRAKDAHSEHRLRRQEPPTHLITEEIEQLTREAVELLAQPGSEEQLSESLVLDAADTEH